MKKILLENYKYILFFIFVLFLYSYVLVPDLVFDATWEFGMAHAIKIGEIPYLDFNTVSTPFYIMFHSIFLHISDSFYFYLFINGIICTIIYALYDKINDNNSFLCLSISLLLLYRIFIPSYNFMAFFIIVLLIYLEKKQKNDYLIGFVLGLLFLTKHTIGLPVIVLSMFGQRDYKKVIKRIIGIIIPCFIFLMFLFITNSFKSFLDLCILGLFNFNSNNKNYINVFLIMSIIVLIISLFHIVRYKDIKYYYLIGAFSFVIPICDLSHFSFLFALFMLCEFGNVPGRIKYSNIISFIIIIIPIIFQLMLYNYYFKNITYMNDKHFKYCLVNKNSYSEFKSILNKYKQYKSNSTIIDFSAIKYDIILDKKINYYNILLTGNYGLNGSKVLIKDINKSKDHYYIITKNIYYNRNYISQIDYDVIDYIYSNLEKVEEDNLYYVYYKK